jgi:hypothetical protein
MKLKSEYPFRYIVTYIPSYYCNLKEWQVGNRRAVYNFKKGFISEEYKRKIKKGGEMRGETNFFLTYPLRSENCKRRTSGAQVESLIDRREDIINLCEIKYADDEYAFDSEKERKQRNRKTAFKLDTKTRKSVHMTLVTTYGLRKNSHSDIVQSVVTMDDLFRD